MLFCLLEQSRGHADDGVGDRRPARNCGLGSKWFDCRTRVRGHDLLSALEILARASHLSVLLVDDAATRRRLDAPTDAPAWPNSVKSISMSRDNCFAQGVRYGRCSSTIDLAANFDRPCSRNGGFRSATLALMGATDHLTTLDQADLAMATSALASTRGSHAGSSTH